VLLNLMINAAQAMGHAGRIVVSIAESDQRCLISVADQGPGIPEDIREKVFDPFFTTKHRGTGLGLAVARRTVDLHGGKLRVECPPEGGTMVIVSLPVTGT
jgi:signal transduction histidine kinase